MGIQGVIKHDVMDRRRLSALKPVKDEFRKKKGLYRINVWMPPWGKELKAMHIMDFVPCGKVTNAHTGEYRWLKMRNGRMVVVPNRKRTGP